MPSQPFARPSGPISNPTGQVPGPQGTWQGGPVGLAGPAPQQGGTRKGVVVGAIAAVVVVAVAAISILVLTRSAASRATTD